MAASCDTGNLIVAFFSFLGDPIGTILNTIADYVLAAALKIFAAMAESVPTLPGTQESQKISDQTQWLVVYLAVGSLIYASIRMAIEQKAEGGTVALKGMMRVILVSTGASTIVLAAASLADNYSQFLWENSSEELMDNIAHGCSKAETNLLTPILILVLAFLLLIASIIHTILLYIRLGIMIVMLGTLPLAAAASMTTWGGGWWRKHIGWMIAWLLYKPAAALVMYSGAVLINNGNDYSSTDDDSGAGLDINVRIAGIGVMLLATVALPALLKIVVPATAALGGGSAMSSGMSQAAGGLASGAKSLAGGSGDSGGGGGSGSRGPTGSRGSNGSSGGGGDSGGGGKSGGSGAGGKSGAAGGAGKAAGAAGMAAEAATKAIKVIGSTAAHGADGADGDRGHNR